MIKKLLFFLLLIAAVGAVDQVEIGTHILNIGDYDIEKGSYTIDFYIWFLYEGVSPEHFEIMNGEIISKEDLSTEEGELFYRIRARLFEAPDFTQFPQDTQTLTIKIEDAINPNTVLVYTKADGIAVDSELNVLGWDLVESKASISEKDYPNFEETYSRYTHQLTISRPSSSIWKILIPFFFIIVSAWAAFFIPLHKLGEKLALAGTALLSAVVYHLFLTEQIPPVGYLVLADKIAIAMYAMLVYTIISLIIVEREVVSQHHAHAKRTNMFLTLFVPFILLGTFVLLQIFF